ncbi:MAG: cation:proton antiporter [Thermoanaerobaculum sp.]
MSAATFLVLAGGFVFLAYVTEGFLEKLKVPPVLVLMAAGLIMGPVTGWLPAERFRDVAPHFGSLAFLLILLEGGLDLQLEEVQRGLKKGLALAFRAFGLAVVGVAAFLILVGRPWREALLLAVALAPVSGSIVLPLVGRLPVGQGVRTLATLEAAVADVMALLTMEAALTLLERGGWGSLVALGSLMAALFSVVLAVICGLLWPPFLRRLGHVPHADVLTFALAMLLWGLVELPGASGALAVLTFGLVMANEREVLELLGFPSRVTADIAEATVARLHRFIQQLTFLVRTFFFVFLGVVVSRRGFSAPVLLTAVGAWLWLVLSRYWLFFRSKHLGEGLEAWERKLLWLLQPRGLVSAVLALVATDAGYGSTWFLPVTSGVIVLSNLVLIVALKQRPPSSPGGSPGGSSRSDSP